VLFAWLGGGDRLAQGGPVVGVHSFRMQESAPSAADVGNSYIRVHRGLASV
jgi:hypothetical protein